MGKITEGKAPLPTAPKTATHAQGELPSKNIKTEGIKKFNYTPKVKSQIGDSGKG